MSKIVPTTAPFSVINALAGFTRMLTVDEVSELIGLSSCTVYRMAQRKQIPSVILSGSRRFDPATISMWLARKDPQLSVAAQGLRAA